MAFLAGLGRLAPLLVGGAAAAWYLRRQGLLGGRPRDRLPLANEREPPEAGPLEAHVEAVEAVSDAADVTTVVEDLLAVAPGEGEEIAEAEVVEEDQDRGSPPPAG